MKKIKTIQDLMKLRKTDKFVKAPHMVREAVLLGDWEEVNGIAAETIKPELGTEKLDGLILKGYEMKFGQTNENGEQYEPGAFDKFIQDYFVDRKLNMPVDINHQGWNDWRAYCGRVLYIEVNTVGFYFVVYVPRTFAYYEDLKNMLQNGIIQGFSKEGWATDWEPRWNEDGSFAYEIIKEIAVVSVSLVCTPANGLSFERMQEIKNALLFKNTTKDNASGSTLAAMFNK
jgi:HK97 family phage prohead protease